MFFDNFGRIFPKLLINLDKDFDYIVKFWGNFWTIFSVLFPFQVSAVVFSWHKGAYQFIESKQVSTCSEGVNFNALRVVSRFPGETMAA